MASKLSARAPFTGRLCQNTWNLPVMKSVKSRLECDDTIPQREIEYLKRHPTHVIWIKNHTRPSIWQKFVADQNANRPLVASGGKEHSSLISGLNQLTLSSFTWLDDDELDSDEEELYGITFRSFTSLTGRDGLDSDIDEEYVTMNL